MKNTKITGALAAFGLASVGVVGLAGAASADSVVSTDPGCAPVTAADAVTHTVHTDAVYGYRNEITQQVFTSSDASWLMDHPLQNIWVNTWHAADVAAGDAVVVDTPAVQGVTCEIPLPANPLAGGVVDPLKFTAPADTSQYSWSGLADHTVTDGKEGITVTAKPGYVFAYGNGTLASKSFTAQGRIAVPTLTRTELTETLGATSSPVKVLVKDKTGAALAAGADGYTLIPGHTYDVVLTVTIEDAQSFTGGAAAGWREYTNAKGLIFKVSQEFTVPEATPLDFGNPYFSHGAIYPSHVRGGVWSISSVVYSPTGEFSTHGGTPASVSTAQGVTRYRITFTPDLWHVNAIETLSAADLPSLTFTNSSFVAGPAFQATPDTVSVEVYIAGDHR